MNDDLITIPRVSDIKIYDLFEKIAETLDSTITLNIYGDSQTTTIKPNEDNEIVSLIKQSRSCLIKQLSTGSTGFRIYYHRGGYVKPNSSVQLSPVYDQIQITSSSSHARPEAEIRFKIVTEIQENLDALEPSKYIANAIPQEYRELIGLQTSKLERLEDISTKIIEDYAEYRREVENKYADRKFYLEQEASRIEGQLKADHNQKLDSLADKEEELTLKIKQVDDRKNTHVRREIRSDILEKINERLKQSQLSDNTNKLRSPTHITTICILLLLGIANVYYISIFSEIVTMAEPPMSSVIVSSIKQLTLSLAFGFMVVFYLKWLNSWSAKHADNEFKLRQFQLDIERASWVVETAFEWKEAKGKAIPTELLEPISRNLFDDNPDKNHELHPADELASALMGTAANVKLRTGESEVELDAKKLRDSN